MLIESLHGSSSGHVCVQDTVRVTRLRLTPLLILPSLCSACSFDLLIIFKSVLTFLFLCFFFFLLNEFKDKFHTISGNGSPVSVSFAIHKIGRMSIYLELTPCWAQPESLLSHPVLTAIIGGTIIITIL